MPVPRSKLSQAEICQAFLGKAGDEFPVILSPARLAQLIGQSRKTVYEWIARGRLNGAFRKRGKHILLWRDRVIDILFNGKEWSNENEQ